MLEYLKRIELELCEFYGVKNINEVLDTQKKILRSTNGTGSEENNI